jgi:hypothetical protein
LGIWKRRLACVTLRRLSNNVAGPGFIITATVMLFPFVADPVRDFY